MEKQQPNEFEALEAELSALDVPEPRQWSRVREALERRADAEDLVDVAFERHDSPLGVLVLGATREGIVRVGFASDGEANVLDEFAREISPRVLRAPREPIALARHQLDEYFDGRRRAFAVPLDWRLTRGFRREVLFVTAQIPYGRTATYREIAARTTSPAAIRAAGSALATNPLPILVPCHRVVPSSGGLGNYRGGAEAKARLLDLERGARA